MQSIFYSRAFRKAQSFSTRLLLLLLLGGLIGNFVSAQTDQLVISEVTVDGGIEIFNGTSGTINVSDYWLCNFPSYVTLSSIDTDCGSLNLEPGETVVVSGWNGFDGNDGEVGLYSASGFGDEDNIVSYLEYGSANHFRSSVAVAAGIWTAGDFLTAPTAAASIQTQADASGSLSYVNQTPNLCTPDGSLAGVTVEGGAITLDNGGTETSICVDAVADPLTILRDGNGEGPNREFVITDDVGNILALPGVGVDGPFDLNGAGEGVCEIWYLAYEDGLQNLTVGNNLSDLTGTFDLSNPVTVIRQAPDGGMVSLADGSTVYEGVAGDIVIDVQHTTTATELSYWYIITDDNDDILAFANSAVTSTLDLSGAPGGTCHVWGWSYRGEGDPIPGDNISTLTDGDCETISDNFITVIRQAPASGGAITLADGATETSICVDDVADPLEVIRDGNSMGTNREFVITDDAGNILALPGAGMNGPFDLNGAGVGDCEIWYLAYEDGLTGLATGNNLTDLDGNFGLSNPITVVRQAPDGGTVSLLDGSTTIEGTAGNIVIEVQHETVATALSYWYIITDDNDNILAFANSAETNTLDLSGAPVGTCHVWGWSYRGEGDPIPGDNISTLADGDCEAISTNFITVIRNELVDGGAISLTNGDTETSICVDDVADPLEVVRDGNGVGTNREFVITDDLGNILALPGAGMNGPFDLNGAGVGTCEIWYLAYSDGLTGLIAGNNLTDLEGNFDLSNPITVIRQAPDGGTVSLLDGSTTYTGVAGNIVIDVQHETVATELSYWYIITDENDDILAFANSEDTNTLDLSGAPGGICHVWGWSYRGEGDPIPGDNISTLADGDCEAISTNFITVIRQAAAEGGAISLIGGSTDTVICVNDVADPLEVIRDGNGAATNREFVITDDAGNILALPGAGMNGPFDLNGAGVGICDIWYLAYEDVLTGLAVGNNIADLEGNFDFSNPITVVRQAPDGGMVSLADGSTVFTGDAGDIVVDVQFETEATALSYWYVITDENDIILEAVNSVGVTSLDLSAAPVGECHIWGWSYRGEGDPIPGDNISSLTDGDCETISENFITIIRNPAGVVNGGGITLIGGSTDTSICVNGIGDPLEVIRDGNGEGENREFVITDDIGNILALPGAGMNGPFDLDGAGVGDCEIWYLAYQTGLSNLEVGSNLDDLDGVFALSNPITVVRQAPDGGTITLADGSTTFTGEAGNIIVDVVHETAATALSYWYIITDENDNILEAVNSVGVTSLDLSAAPAGECHIWGWSYRGEGDPVPGDNISSLTDGDCETISDGFITVIRQEPNAVNRFGQEIGLKLFPNPVRNQLNISIDGLDSEAALFEVYDLQGRRIVRRPVDQANGTNNIELNNVPAGNYVLRVISGSVQLTRQFSKF